MRLRLCTLPTTGRTVHVFQPVPIRRRFGWHETGRLITVGYTYRCDRCGEVGYAA